jgi:hypothetical protein
VFIELVDMLRCVQPHADTWLVASVDRMVGRDIVDGTLGCPICEAEYAVRDGVVYFSARAETRVSVEADPAEAMRLAAALALTDAGATAVVHGRWAAQARLVRALSPAQLLALNPASDVEGGDGVSVIVSDIAPFAAGSVSAIAIDAGASGPLIDSLVHALRPGGRALGPLGVAVPAEISELVRDDEVWVGERQGTASPMIALKRARPRGTE